MDREDQDSLEDSMAAFAAALQPKKVELAAPKVVKILLALDGSGQDATARRLAQYLSLRTGAPTVERSGLADGRQLVAAVREAGASLVVVPAPFGEEYEASRGESLGSVIDVLLAESDVPAVLVRAPVEDAAAAFGGVLVPFSACDHATQRAAAWAFAVVGPGGKVELLDVPDVAALEEARRLLGDQGGQRLDEATLERSATKDAGALVGAAQRLGGERGLQVEFTVRAGHPVEQVLEASGGARVAILGLPRELDAPGRHRAHDIAARSAAPVLLV